MPTSNQPPVVYQNQVRFQETDRQGIVFYGTFFTYQDEAVNNYLRSIGFPYHKLEDNGWTTHTVHADLDYYAPAEFGDIILNRLQIEAISNSSITAEYIAERKTNNEKLAEGTVVHVAVDHETTEPIPVPPDFRDAVVDYQHIPPDPV